MVTREQLVQWYVELAVRWHHYVHSSSVSIEICLAPGCVEFRERRDLLVCPK